MHPPLIGPLGQKPPRLDTRFQVTRAKDPDALGTCAKIPVEAREAHEGREVHEVREAREGREGREDIGCGQKVA